MLSSSITNCLSSSFTYSNLIDLKTAKKNLQSMEFFGLTEYLHLSQRLFEQTKFCQLFQICSFQSYDYLEQNLTFSDFKYLKQINSDDIELYEFAKKLFFQRTCRILGIAC
jgi:heparan sulfate 6-O-sulfotransferase HS6ST1